jgi:acyl transferase domain-containing protein
LPSQALYLKIHFAGVSSLAYNGTIAHVVLRRARVAATFVSRVSHLLYARRSFLWRDPPHPLLQERFEKSMGSPYAIFHSRAQGSFYSLVANHVVQGRVVFPAAGYLEMARAANGAAANLQAVFFLVPLVLSVAAGEVKVVIESTQASFEVRSSASSDEEEVHCSGDVDPSSQITNETVSFDQVRQKSPIQVGRQALYEAFDRAGLQYGPVFRALTRVWAASDRRAAAAELRLRTSLQGTQVHPADLDAALQLSAAGAALYDASKTRLPFAINRSVLRRGTGRLHAAVESSGSDA